MTKIENHFKKFMKNYSCVLINNLEIKDHKNIEEEFTSFKACTSQKYKTYSLHCEIFYKPIIRIVNNNSINNIKNE